MIVLIGHGPSIVGKRLGPWLDEQTVVRLKAAEIPDPADWGTRTDYICASNPGFLERRIKSGLKPIDCEYWVMSEHHQCGPRGYKMRFASRDWFTYWNKYLIPGSRLKKPSTGLRAAFCAVEFLKPTELGLIGFDNILHPERPITTKWFHEPGKYSYAHEAKAEHRALMDLGVTITEL
jgi:hypothetical protein